MDNLLQTVISLIISLSNVFNHTPEVSPGSSGVNSFVLAASTSQPVLEINADVVISGLLELGDYTINGISLNAADGGGFNINNLTVLGDIVGGISLDQNLSSSSSPTFSSLTLSGSLNSLTLPSAGTGTTATSLVGTDTTQTLTNKTISGSSNTISGIANAALSSSKVTVSAGTGLSGGGDVSLGSSVTLSLKDDGADFTSLEDTLDLDTATEINLGSSNLTIDLDSTGDFILTDGGTAFVTFDDSGVTTIAGTLTLNGIVNIGDNGENVVINSNVWDITGAGVVSGLTGISSSGTITLSDITASRFVVTDGSSNLAATALSSVLLNTLSDEVGTGVAVFGPSPTITTSLLTDSTPFGLIDSTATTINFGSAATTLNINDGAVTSTIDIGGVTNSGTNTINIATEGTAADVLSIGNSNASTTVAITGGNDWSVTAAGVLTVASCSGCGGAFTNGQQTVSPTVTGPIANLTNDVTPIAAGATGVYSTLNYLPQGLRNITTTSWNNYIYVVGGADTAGNVQSTVYSAQVKADGTIGTWSTLTYLPGARNLASAVAANGYLFVVDGTTGLGSSATTGAMSTIYSAPINSDGTIGV